jgi:tetratricopeptide (TPR) repeat protein
MACRLLTLAIALTLAAAASAAAEDVVYLRTGEGGLGRSRMTGVIVEYTGDVLQLQTGTGRTVKIPAAKVAHVESTWTDEHVRGDTLLAAGKWEEALEAYRAAFQRERRQWVQNMIRARVLHCAGSLGKAEEACTQFLLLLRSDPATPYFHLIPLAWRPTELTTSLARRAETWMNNGEVPAAALLGASWLLATGRREAAVAALTRLSTNPDRRIAQLAVAQLWRTKLVSAQQADADRWQTVAGQIPEPLRAGPYFVVGKILARQQRHEQAALAFLRVPILYPAQRSLAAEALWEAAGQLKRLGSDPEAAGLYRELFEGYPDSPYAEAARGELTRTEKDG